MRKLGEIILAIIWIFVFIGFVTVGLIYGKGLYSKIYAGTIITGALICMFVFCKREERPSEAKQ